MKTQRGFALMQVLIAIPIVAILSMAIATMMSNFAKQNRELSQKLDTLEFKQQLTSLTNDDTSCKNMMSGFKFDPNATPNTSFATLKTSPTGTVLATAGAVLPTSSSQVKVSTMQLLKTAALSATQYGANLRITWDPSTLAMGLQPVIIPMFVTIDGSQNIIDCTPGSGGGGNLQSCTTKAGTCTSSSGTYTCSCPSGEVPVFCQYSYTIFGGKNPGTYSSVGSMNGGKCTANPPYGSSWNGMVMNCCASN